MHCAPLLNSTELSDRDINTISISIKNTRLFLSLPSLRASEPPGLQASRLRLRLQIRFAFAAAGLTAINKFCFCRDKPTCLLRSVVFDFLTKMFHVFTENFLKIPPRCEDFRRFFSVLKGLFLLPA